MVNRIHRNGLLQEAFLFLVVNPNDQGRTYVVRPGLRCKMGGAKLPPFAEFGDLLPSEGKPLGAESSNSPVYLIRQAANRDREAFSQLYDRFSALVYTFAVRMLRAPQDAEDLLQEVFTQVWHQADRYSEERGSPEAWI